MDTTHKTETAPVIGICGPAGSGKSTLAAALAEAVEARGFECSLLPMAGHLKRIAMEVFGWNGVKDGRGRRFLQLLGTDAVRECLDEDYWVDLWSDDADRSSGFVVADDIRFPNEARRVLDMGGVVVQLRDRAGDLGDNGGHKSERDIPPELVTMSVSNREGTDINAVCQKVLDCVFRRMA